MEFDHILQQWVFPSTSVSQSSIEKEGDKARIESALTFPDGEEDNMDWDVEDVKAIIPTQADEAALNTVRNGDGVYHSANSIQGNRDLDYTNITGISSLGTIGCLSSREDDVILESSRNSLISNPLNFVEASEEDVGCDNDEKLLKSAFNNRNLDSKLKSIRTESNHISSKFIPVESGKVGGMNRGSEIKNSNKSFNGGEMDYMKSISRETRDNPVKLKFADISEDEIDWGDFDEPISKSAPSASSQFIKIGHTTGKKSISLEPSVISLKLREVNAGDVEEDEIDWGDEEVIAKEACIAAENKRGNHSDFVVNQDLEASFMASERNHCICMSAFFGSLEWRRIVEGESRRLLEVSPSLHYRNHFSLSKLFRHIVTAKPICSLHRDFKVKTNAHKRSHSIPAIEASLIRKRYGSVKRACSLTAVDKLVAFSDVMTTFSVKHESGLNAMYWETL